jgi:hypothetical protein
MTMHREKMRTIGGLSVRAEIDARLEAAREDARSRAFDEAVAFLRLSGHPVAADDLERAAFTTDDEVPA